MDQIDRLELELRRLLSEQDPDTIGEMYLKEILEALDGKVTSNWISNLVRIIKRFVGE